MDAVIEVLGAVVDASKDGLVSEAVEDAVACEFRHNRTLLVGSSEEGIRSIA